MNAVIVLDPEGDGFEDLQMKEEATSAWIRIGDSELVVRLYRPRKRAEDEDGQVHSRSAALGVEIYESRRALEEQVPTYVFAVREGER